MSSQIPTLETDRLVLRPPSLSSADHYDEFYTDPAASGDYGGPLSAAQAWQRLVVDVGYWHIQGFGVWVVERKDDRRIVGGCGFWQGRGWPRELTWWLLPEARGSGIAAESSRAAIAHAYNVFGWESVQTYMADSNEPARRLVIRLGGVEVRRMEFPDGQERSLYELPPQT